MGRRGYQGPVKGLAEVNMDRFEAALDLRNMSGSELARRIGTSQQRLNGLRFGRTRRIRVDDAMRIEDILGVERGRIFTYDARVAATFPVSA